MNIYELLKADHDNVKSILEKVKEMTEQGNEKEQQSLLEKVRTELFSHNEAEEQTFYEALQQYPETQDMILENEEEHEKVEGYLMDLKIAGEGRKNIEEQKDIIETITHHLLLHIEKEENQLFPQSKELLSQDQLVKLAEDFIRIKKEME